MVTSLDTRCPILWLDFWAWFVVGVTGVQKVGWEVSVIAEETRHCYNPSICTAGVKLSRGTFLFTFITACVSVFIVTRKSLLWAWCTILWLNTRALLIGIARIQKVGWDSIWVVTEVIGHCRSPHSSSADKGFNGCTNLTPFFTTSVYKVVFTSQTRVMVEARKTILWLGFWTRQAGVETPNRIGSALDPDSILTVKNTQGGALEFVGIAAEELKIVATDGSLADVARFAVGGFCGGANSLWLYHRAGLGIAARLS